MAETRTVFTKSDDFKSEYSCAVVRVGTLTPVEGSDFLAKTDVFGTQIVIRKDQVNEGDVMIYAANETQLNERFLSVNNMFEISVRDKNANAEEVGAIMAEYEPIKKAADELKNKIKNVKNSMDQMKKKSDQAAKQAKKKQKELDELLALKTESDAPAGEAAAEGLIDNPGEMDARIDALKAEIADKQKFSDDCLKRAMEKTTVYTGLVKEKDDLIASGKHIVDEAKKHCGFFNKYGRVRCLTLKGCPSFGVLFSPKDLQKFDESITDEEINEFVGNEFDTVNGELFVKVFVPPMPKVNERRPRTNKAQKKVERFDRIIPGELFFHYDTSQFNKNIQHYKPEDVVDISKKIHGTSMIAGKLHIKNPIPLFLPKKVWNGLIDFINRAENHKYKQKYEQKEVSYVVEPSEIVPSGTINTFKDDKTKPIPFTKSELRWNKFIDFICKSNTLKFKQNYTIDFGPVYCSRTVIKNQYINAEVGQGYYNVDLWSEWGEIVYPYLENGMTIYGEIAGYLTGSSSPIQKMYDYGCKEGENILMLYRITTSETDEEGQVVHHEWEVPEVKEWTEHLIERMKSANDDNWKRIHPIDLLYHGPLEDLYPELDTENHWHENLLKRMKDDERFDMEKNEPLCINEVPCEGIVIRKANDSVLRADKLKCTAFLIGEALRVDSGDFVDVEMAQGYGDGTDDNGADAADNNAPEA